MKRIMFIIFIGCQFLVFSQNITLVGDASTTWEGDTGAFSITNQYLQLNDTIARTSALFTASTLINAVWEFQFQLDFAPSGSNRVRFYLAADTNSPTLITSSYVIDLGESGNSDALELKKIINTKEQVLIRGREVYGNKKDSISIKVIHSSEGTWELFSDTSGQKNYDSEGIATDSSITKSNYVGIECEYTLSRATKFRFLGGDIHPYSVDTVGPKIVENTIINDSTIKIKLNKNLFIDSLLINNIEINQAKINSYSVTSTNSFTIHSNPLPINQPFSVTIHSLYDLVGNKTDTSFFFFLEKDISPPQIIHVEALNTEQLSISLNEAILPSELHVSDIQLNGINATQLQYKDSVITAFFETIPVQQEFDLTIDKLSDLTGNTRAMTSIRIPKQTHEPLTILITEFLIDPDEALGLPNYEFVELNYAGNKAIQLNDWQLCDAVTCVKLPAYSLKNETIILTSTAGEKEYDTYGTALGISGFPTFNNDQDEIILKDQFGTIIDRINYSEKWFQDSGNQQGFSWEKVNAVASCNSITNQNKQWQQGSLQQNGSPGTFNFTNKTDYAQPLEVTNVYPINDTLLEVYTNEFLLMDQLHSTYFTITNDVVVTSILQKEAIGNYFQLNTTPLHTQTTYTLSARLTDCSNTTSTFVSTFGLPEPMSTSDLIFSEIMYEPEYGNPEYIELYNRSNKFISTEGLKMGYSDSSPCNGTYFPDDLTPFSPPFKVIAPNEYLVISNTLFDVPNAILHDLPQLTNEGLGLVLYDADFSVLDQVYYSPEMHYEGITNSKGISLEKINVFESSCLASNWTSSSNMTPGQENSANGSATIKSLTITPTLLDVTYSESDLMTFEYQFNEERTGSCSVYDTHGILQERIINTNYLALNGSFSWSTQALTTGNYIILWETWDIDGNTSREKYVVTIVK